MLSPSFVATAISGLKMFFVAQSGLSYFIGMSRSSGDRDCRIPGAILAPMPPAEIVTGTLSELEDALADAVVHAREPDPLAPVTVLVGHVLLKRYLPRMLAARGIGQINVRFVRPNELAESLSPESDRERARLSPAAERLLVRRVAASAERLLRGDRGPRRVHRSADAAVPRTGAGRLRRPGAASPGAARRRPGRQPREVRRTGGALRRLLRAARALRSSSRPPSGMRRSTSRDSKVRCWCTGSGRRPSCRCG